MDGREGKLKKGSPLKQYQRLKYWMMDLSGGSMGRRW